MKRIALENLAVMFRVNDPNLRHCSTLETMQSAGLAFIYGIFCGTPRTHKRKLAGIREQIAVLLCEKAESLK